ncbi:hypothetical protein BDV98DRAFT_608979 [Pterulicium gracile]|uniref:Rhodopsin domain-containing protein n=1 Tax=Pterulicium gracile TaxID=1884261 RepID=A0A5C3Q0T0_9AGAR|nr:hypothetical protein BDV98DRAFT_608979 [Pterula gracilis]
MEPTIGQFRVLNGVILSAGVALTIARLAIRYSRGKLWWDDYWAILAAACGITYMVGGYVFLSDHVSYPVAVFYLCLQAFYAATWSSRISILFTVARLARDNTRRILIYGSLTFVGAWIFLLGQVFYVCEQVDLTWRTSLPPRCNLGLGVGIAQAVTFVLSDIVLVAAPIKLLWNVKLNLATKIRLFAVFLATLVTTGISFYYIYAVLNIGGLEEQWASTIYTGVALIVMNLTVIISFLFTLRSSEENGTSNPATPYSTSDPRQSTKRRVFPLTKLSRGDRSRTACFASQTQISVHIDIVHDGVDQPMPVFDGKGSTHEKRWQEDVEGRYKPEVFHVKGSPL